MINNQIIDAWQEKAVYEQPIVKIVGHQDQDVITASGYKDENQGEWDPQCLSLQERGF